MKKEEEGIRIIKKPLKTGAICGVLVFILAFIFVASSFVLKSKSTGASLFANILFVAINLLFIFFVYGYFYLGKSTGNKLLKITSALVIFWIILSYSASFAVNPLLTKALNMTVTKATSLGLDLNSIGTDQFQQLVQALSTDATFVNLFKLIAGIYLIALAISAVLFLFYEIGVLKLGTKVKFAKPSGLLAIVGLILLIAGLFTLPSKLGYLAILLGVMGTIISFILQIMILFNEAKKIKEN